MKRKILVDLLNLATPEIAGVGVFARSLFELWLEDKNLPYTIVFYASAAVDVEKVFRLKPSANIQIRNVNAKNVLSRFLYQQILLPFRLRKYDLYFNPTLGIPFLARIIALNVKLVVTIHDMIPFFFPKKYSRLRGTLVKAMSLYAARAAHKVITVSQNSKNDIIALAAVPHDKVTVVYNFISPPYYLSNEADNKFFLCISTLEPGKNVENTILGFAEFIRRTKAPYKFYWVGRVGWVYTQEYVEQLVKKENLENHFVLTGYVTEEKKKELLRTCTAIVYLSHYEGFGLPVLEGMAYNKAAIVSNNSSLPEVVGEAGVVCDAVDIKSISEALRDAVANRHDLEKKIPAQLAKFSPNVQIELFNRTLQELLR